VPGIYLTPRGAADGGPVEAPDNAFHADPRGLLGALASLAGQPPDPTAVEELRRVLDLLPPFTEIFAAAAMLSRPSARSPRVVVRRFRPEALETFLVALDRREAARELGPLARELGRHDARLALVLDLGASAPGVVGLEVRAGRPWPEGSADGWAPVLEALVGAGLAEGNRAEAAASLPGPRRPGAAAVGISHVKVAADGDGLRAAKLYIGVDGLRDAIEESPRAQAVGVA
jgi:hypothetical protein